MAGPYKGNGKISECEICKAVVMPPGKKMCDGCVEYIMDKLAYDFQDGLIPFTAMKRTGDLTGVTTNMR